MKKIMNDLNKQLIVGISAIVFVSTLLIATLFLTQYRSVTLSKAEDDLLLKAQEFTEIGKMMLTPNHQRPRDTYFDIMRNMMGNELTILDRSGNVLVATSKVNNASITNLNRDFINNSESIKTYSFSDYFGTKTLSVISPIIDDGNIIGTVFLHQNVDAIYSSYVSLLYLVVFSLIFSLVLSIILAILYAKRFVLPIEKMTSVARMIKDGDYKAKVGIVRTDQLGELSSTLDQMTDEIDNNINEIRELELRAKELVANVSHEFKTPLTVIRGYAYSLKDKAIKPSNEVYDKIIKNTVELEHLVNDLLDLNNYQIGNINLKKEDMDLLELVNEVSSELSFIAKEKNISINVIAKESVIINADYAKMKQFLIILVDNAIKYSKVDSIVTIELDQKEIKVSDNGVGIDSKELDKIFDRYYKVSSDEAGYGIGLCIAKFIAVAHDFNLEVKSRKNKGTTVYLRFGA